MVAPITTKHHKRMEKYYIPVTNASKYKIKESNVILNQIKLIDTKRLIETASPIKTSIEFVDCVLD
jgi:PemK-like, MazF-like toxin of type II toxin-antitoxin system